jgi:hypothetical protein
MIKLLQCVTDEKFTDVIISEFDSISKCFHSIYAHIANYPIKEYKFVHQKDRIVEIKPIDLNEFIEKNNIQVVVLHSLYTIPLMKIISLPKYIKVVWLAWGYDLYCNTYPLVQLDLYKSQTKKELERERNQNVKRIVKNIIIKIIPYKKWILHKAVNRIDYFSGILPEEYQFVNRLTFFHAKGINFAYYRDNKFPKDAPIIKGNNIMIGNSGDPSNNHLDIFEILKQYDLEDRNIYVPLSYAGTLKYREKVKEVGLRYWGEHFKPITKFLPLQEYSKMISSCGYRIFGHERQQAIGNIEMGLYSGCTVFLSRTSVAYKFYEKMGINIYTIQHDTKMIENKDHISDQQVVENRQYLLKNRSVKKFHMDLINSFKMIENDIQNDK